MKKLSLLSVLLVGCSSLQHVPIPHRDLASLEKDGSFTFDLQLSQPITFANGADTVDLKFQIKDESSQPVKIDLSQVKILVDGRAGIGEITYRDGAYYTVIRPKIKSPTLKVVVIYKNQVSRPIELQTTLKPLSEKMAGIKSDSVTSISVNNMTYNRQEKFPQGRFEGFTLSNTGPNPIISEAEDSLRDFDFMYPEQAGQNMSLLVTDQPNGTVSHTMHSYFMFFPRTYLPLAEVNADQEVRVTLPNGEEMVFAKSGEIIGGVFKEGPIDYGRNREDPNYRGKRTYAALRYQGKGIVLRANARGQMPQQGEFEKTPIDDKDFGIKYSADVLIINGSGGKPCRRPKSDFWSNADVSPILFKFPSDKEFDAYLKAKCGWGIPELKIDIAAAPVDATEAIKDVWARCENSGKVQSCIGDEVALLTDRDLKVKVSYELTLRYLSEKKEEEKIITELLIKEVASIRSTLLKEASWLPQGCLEKSQSLVQAKLKYSDIQSLIKEPLAQNCTTVRAEMEKIASEEVTDIKAKLEADLAWASLSPSPKIAGDCLKQAKGYIIPGFRYYEGPEIYEPSLKTICGKMEESESFKAWLKTQSAGLEEKITLQVLTDVEARAEKLAQSCLEEFPADTQFNRLRFKKARESCLMDGWSDVESLSVEQAKKDPVVQKVGLNMDSIASRVGLERRRLQLKVIKKYFL